MNNLLYLFSIVLFISCNGNIEKKEFNNINNPLLVGDFLFVNKNSDSFEENKLLGEDSLEILKPTYITELDLSNETKFAIKRAVFLGTQEKLSLQENFELDSLYKIYGEREDVWYIGEIGCSWYCGGGPYKISSSSILKDNRIVFNIKGNDYRLIVKFNFEYQLAWIRFIGTHTEYNKINANEI